MYRQDLDIDSIKAELACAEADLWQGCGSMSVTSLESLCRRINMYKLKLYSFKQGRNGNKE